jgi:hypothetical protein
MITLFHEGGFPMWFVLLFGTITLGAAIRFAIKADRRQLGFIIGLSVATLFSVLVGFVADLGAVGHNVAGHWDKFYSATDGYQGVVMAWSQGFAESMSPGILGFTLLSLTWLIAAVGLSRSSRLQAA